MNETKDQSIKVMDDAELDSMVVTYGRRIYLRLLSRCENRDIAKQALKDVLVELYTAMKTSGCNNPLEAMLYIKAQQKQDEVLSKTISYELEDVLEEISAPQLEAKREVPKSPIPHEVQTYEARPQPHPEKPPIYEAKPQAHSEKPPVYEAKPQVHAERPPVYEAKPQMYAEKPPVSVESPRPQQGSPQAYARMPETPMESARPVVPPSPPNNEVRPQVTPPVQKPRTDEAAQEAARQAAMWQTFENSALPKMHTEPVHENKKPKKQPFLLSFLLIVLLLAGIFAMLWAITGLLMATGLIPMIDLGYSWFNGFVFPLF